MESSEPQNPPPPQPAPSGDTEDLRQQCQDLRTLFNATFIGLIALALAVNLFLGKQMRAQQRENERVQPAFSHDDRLYRQSVDPDIHRVMKQLQYYAATHPEYQTNVFYKYRVVLAEFFSTGAGVGEPPPLPRPAPSGGARPAGR